MRAKKKSFVGYAVALVGEKRVLVEPVLLCKTRQRVHSRLKVYLEQTAVQTSEHGSVKIIKCPAVMAINALTKADNLCADRFSRAALKKCLRKLAGTLGGPHAFELAAGPSKMRGVRLLNIGQHDRTRLRMILGLLDRAMPDVLRDL